MTRLAAHPGLQFVNVAALALYSALDSAGLVALPGVSAPLVVFAVVGGCLELCGLDRILLAQLCGNFSVVLTLGNALLYLALTAASGVAPYSSPGCVLANTLCRALVLLMSLPVDARGLSLSPRARSWRLLLACGTWIRLIGQQYVAPQTNLSTTMCLEFCTTYDNMAFGAGVLADAFYVCRRCFGECVAAAVGSAAALHLASDAGRRP